MSKTKKTITVVPVYGEPQKFIIQKTTNLVAEFFRPGNDINKDTLEAMIIDGVTIHVVGKK